jgi:hypothetical protein
LPVAVMSAVFLSCGAALLATKDKWAVRSIIISGFLAIGFYHAFALELMGGFQMNLVSLVAYISPFVLLHRGKKAMAYIDKIDGK